MCFSQHPEPNTARPVAAAYRLVAEVFGAEPFSPRGVWEENFTAGVTQITFTRPESDERIVVVWNTRLDDTEYTVEATSEQATLRTLDGTETITAEDGGYTLDLPGGEPDNNPYARDWEVTTVGGMPVILIEDISGEAAQELLLETRAVTPEAPAEPTSIPGAGLSEDEIAALTDDSPTGVVFVSLNISRIRSRPDTTAESRVLGNINPGQAASVVGQTPDGGWYQIDFNGQPVWVASFLGDVYGDLAGVPAVPYPTETPE